MDGGDWIHKRYKNYREKKERQRIEDRWQADAIVTSPKLFDDLKNRVAQDIKVYNEEFSKRAEDQDCLASMEDVDDGLVVSVGPNSARVTKEQSTSIIRLEWRVAMNTKQDHFEVAQDDNGRIGYKHGMRESFIDPGQASQIILDSILCG